MGDARFYTQELAPGLIRLSTEESRHALGARRLSVEDPVALFDGLGHEGVGRIASTGKRVVEVEVTEVVRRERPRPQLTLAVAVPKGPRQDVLIEKCTELGVTEIWPVVAERSVAGVSAHRLSKWRRTAVEAAKQSGQCWLPALHTAQGIGETLQHLRRFDRTVVATGAWPCGARPGRLADALNKWARAAAILAFVGPEGGWTDEELGTLLAAGAEPVSLGPNVLRIETAAIALAAIAHGLATAVSGSVH